MLCYPDESSVGRPLPMEADPDKTNQDDEVESETRNPYTALKRRYATLQRNALHVQNALVRARGACRLRRACLACQAVWQPCNAFACTQTAGLFCRRPIRTARVVTLKSWHALRPIAACISSCRRVSPHHASHGDVRHSMSQAGPSKR